VISDRAPGLNIPSQASFLINVVYIQHLIEFMLDWSSGLVSVATGLPRVLGGMANPIARNSRMPQ